MRSGAPIDRLPSTACSTPRSTSVASMSGWISAVESEDSANSIAASSCSAESTRLTPTLDPERFGFTNTG